MFMFCVINRVHEITNLCNPLCESVGNGEKPCITSACKHIVLNFGLTTEINSVLGGFQIQFSQL